MDKSREALIKLLNSLIQALMREEGEDEEQQDGDEAAAKKTLKPDFSVPIQGLADEGKNPGRGNGGRS